MAKPTDGPVGQPPILMLHLTDVHFAPSDHDVQWDRFWRKVAEVAGDEIMTVSPSHPDLVVMQALVRDARAAAGLPPVLSELPQRQQHAG